MEPMKKFAAAALAGLAGASTPTQAADLFGTAPPPMSEAADNPMVEIGSNWYIRGDVGASLENVPSLSFPPDATPQPGSSGKGILPFTSRVGAGYPDFTADVGFGYRINNYFRAEATYEYWNGNGGTNTNTYFCPTKPSAFSTCNGALDIRQRNSTLLASAYADLGTFWGVTPYLGAGVGANANMTSGSISYIENVTGTVDPDSWNRSLSNTKFSFAWALMAGFGIQISPSATVDIGYKYLNAGTVSTPITNAVGSVVKESNASQEFRIGIRYMLN
jgi:opacity protein-like surface antigen